MQKIIQWMMAAILICGTTVFTACSSGDDDVKEPPVQPEQPEDDGGNSGTEGEITYISRSWDGEKVVDKKVTTKAQWLNEIQVGPGQEKALSGTWYVTGAHKIQGFLKVEQGKTLDIILCDYCELSLPSIRVEGGTDVSVVKELRSILLQSILDSVNCLKDLKVQTDLGR